jgi:hypothetical protein
LFWRKTTFPAHLDERCRHKRAHDARAIKDPSVEPASSACAGYHRIKDEKRMLVLLPRAQWAEWLDAPVERSMAFVNQYPAERMIAMGHPAAPKTKAAPAKRAATPVQGDLL